MTNQKMEAASTLERWAEVHDMEIFFNLKVGLGTEMVYASKRFPPPPPLPPFRPPPWEIHKACRV